MSDFPKLQQPYPSDSEYEDILPSLKLLFPLSGKVIKLSPLIIGFLPPLRPSSTIILNSSLASSLLSISFCSCKVFVSWVKSYRPGRRASFSSFASILGSGIVTCRRAVPIIFNKRLLSSALCPLSAF
jgi:hypothetical protein